MSKQTYDMKRNVFLRIEAAVIVVVGVARVVVVELIDIIVAAIVAPTSTASFSISRRIVVHRIARCRRRCCCCRTARRCRHVRHCASTIRRRRHEMAASVERQHDIGTRYRLLRRRRRCICARNGIGDCSLVVVIVVIVVTIAGIVAVLLIRGIVRARWIVDVVNGQLQRHTKLLKQRVDHLAQIALHLCRQPVDGIGLLIAALVMLAKSNGRVCKRERTTANKLSSLRRQKQLPSGAPDFTVAAIATAT